MIVYKTLEEIELIRESSQLVSKTLGVIKKHVFPGALPIDLDKIAETFIRDHNAEPGFLWTLTISSSSEGLSLSV